MSNKNKLIHWWDHQKRQNRQFVHLKMRAKRSNKWNRCYRSVLRKINNWKIGITNLKKTYITISTSKLMQRILKLKVMVEELCANKTSAETIPILMELPKQGNYSLWKMKELIPLLPPSKRGRAISVKGIERVWLRKVTRTRHICRSKPFSKQWLKIWVFWKTGWNRILLLKRSI